MTNILFTFAGSNDPFDKSKTADASADGNFKDAKPKDGPILSLLKHKKADNKFYIKFGKVYIFTNNSVKNKEWAEKTKIALEADVKEVEKMQRSNKMLTEKNQTIPVPLEVEIVEINDEKKDPTDHLSLLSALYPMVQDKIAENNKDDNFYISIASGTPAMHALWFLLTSAQEVGNAKILQINRKEDSHEKTNLVREISTEDIVKSTHFKQGILQMGNLENQSPIRAAIQKLDLIPYRYHKGLDAIYERIFQYRNHNLFISGRQGIGKKTMAIFYATLNECYEKLEFFDLDEKTTQTNLEAYLDKNKCRLIYIESLDFLTKKAIENLLIKSTKDAKKRLALVVNNSLITENLMLFFNKLEQIRQISLSEEQSLKSQLLTNNEKLEIVKAAIKKHTKEHKSSDIKEIGFNSGKLFTQASWGELIDDLSKASKEAKAEKISEKDYQTALNTKSSESFEINSLNLKEVREIIINHAIELGGTQDQISARLGITQQQVSKLLKNQRKQKHQ